MSWFSLSSSSSNKLDFLGYDSESEGENYCEMDRCGAARRRNQKPKESIGFKNYVKMYRCRFPGLDKCLLMKKAKCQYENLHEKTKQKYRDLGPGFKCCVRQKAQAASPPCPKPCPKPKCKPKKCKPKKRACDCECGYDLTTDSSSTILRNIIEENKRTMKYL